MMFMVGSKPDDTNNNGFPDAIRASVALFSQEHPTALREDGAFVFTLYPQGQSDIADAQPIAQWRVEGQVAAQSMSLAQYGPCYQFTLSLLDPESGSESGDRLPLDRADIRCTFEPTGGATPFSSAGVRTIQIGSRLLSGR
jgi:hypothetical protein